MKYVSFVLLVLLLSTFSSCAVINPLLGLNKCAYSGCDRQSLDNCNYCAFHCGSYFPPADFNAKVAKSIDEQVKRSSKPINIK